MDCDIEDLSLSLSDVIFRELDFAINFKNSKGKIIELTENYRASGAAIGFILGILTKGLEDEEKIEKLFSLFFSSLFPEIHPLDFWDNFEELVVIRCEELKNWFLNIQDSNKNINALGVVSRMLVFAGNTFTGGMVGEIKSVFEGLFSLLKGISEKVIAPQSFEELCHYWRDCTNCFKILHHMRSRRIYYPSYGTNSVKSLVWTMFYFCSIHKKALNIEQFVNWQRNMWDGYVKVFRTAINGKNVDSDLNLTILGEQRGLKGTIFDNSVPKKSWKEIKGFYNPVPETIQNNFLLLNPEQLK